MNSPFQVAGSFAARRFLLLCMLLLVSVGVQAKQRWVGGTGGEVFAAYCANGQVMAGVEVWTGDDVDAIRPLCALAYGRTQLGPIEPFNRKFGGDGGGSSQRLVCPPEAPVVLGIYATMEGEATPIINSVRLRCGIVGPVQAPTLREGPFFEGPTIDDPPFFMDGELTCGPGEVVGGLGGASGRWLDSIRLICTAPTITAKTVVGSIGKVKPQTAMTVATLTPRIGAIGALTPSPYASYLYTLDAGGALRWYRHDGAATGAPGLVGPRVIANGLTKIWRAVFGEGSGVIYALESDGTLWRYEHTGYRDGLGQDAPGAWSGPILLTRGLGLPVQGFSAGDGVVYFIYDNGDLHWYRVTKLPTGSINVQGPRIVSHGWSGLKAFSGGKGVLYTITPDGTLRWYRHLTYLTGEGVGTPGAWAVTRIVGNGWNAFDKVAANGSGVLYAVTPRGEMFWYHHLGYQDGANEWEARTSIATGLGGTPWLFVQP